MGILTLNEKVLKFLVTRYKETGKEITSFEAIQEVFPNTSKNSLKDALSSLEEEGLLEFFIADSDIYTVTLIHKRIF